MKSSKLTLTLFCIGIVLFWAGLYLYVPTLSVYSKGKGASLSLVGLIAGSYGLAQLIFRVPLGAASDRLGLRKPFVLAGFLVIIASCLGLAWAPTPEWYVAEDDLPALTVGARVFAYPSLYEGFRVSRWPRLPPRASRCSPPMSRLCPRLRVREGFSVDPRSVAEIQNGLARLLTSDTECRRLGEAGRRHAARYRWDDCAARSLEFFRRVASAPRIR